MPRNDNNVYLQVIGNQAIQLAQLQAELAARVEELADIKAMPPTPPPAKPPKV